MATANRQSYADLKTELLSHGERFGFFQALRLLELLSPRQDHSAAAAQEDWERRGTQVRPALSLGFAASDIAKIEERTDGTGYVVTSNFLGLYGVASPLPAFYTEDLFQDAREDSSGPRDFLDMLHHPLFGLLLAGWKKNRLFFQLTETKNPASLEMLYAISGISAAGPRENHRSAYRWIRYTGLLGRRPRSALGLETMLKDFLGGVNISVLPFIPRRVKIPLDQQFQLGTGQNILGQNTFIGEEFMDCQGKFRVRIGPLSHQRFRSLSQDGDEHPALVELIARYLIDPMEYDIELILDGTATEPARLGEQEWSRLGLDMVLFAGEFKKDLSVIFPPAPEDRKTAA